MQILTVRNLTKKYGMALSVDNISFSVSEGEYDFCVIAHEYNVMRMRGENQMKNGPMIRNGGIIKILSRRQKNELIKAICREVSSL